jgi:adenylate kinase
VILLMGLPGSGKGTQGKMLSDEHDFHLFSTGDLSRMYITGERRRRMLAGELLDDNEVIALLERALASVDDDNDCILDGFPRTIPQAEWLMQQIDDGRFTLDHIIHLKVARETLVSRLVARGRLDDKESVIEARFREYERLTQPVLNWFTDRGISVLEIDGERSANTVHRDIARQLGLEEE